MKFFILLGILVCLCSFYVNAQETDGQHDQDIKYEYSKLFDCAQKTYKANPDRDDKTALGDNLVYVLNGKKNELYLYTPYFAGKADLDAVNDGNIRIPYLSPNSSNPSGYYYLTIGGFLHFADRYARVDFPARFLAGDPQAMPDFTNYKSKSHIQITSETGIRNTGVEHHALDIEDKLWDQKSQDNISAEAVNFLIVDLASRINSMPPEMHEGDGSGCEGHAGCDWKVSKEMADVNNKPRQAALDSCKNVANEFYLDIFPPKDMLNTSTEKIKLTIESTPPGARCRCVTQEFWDRKNKWLAADNTFVIDKTPGNLELQKGKYRSVLCECVLEGQQNQCRKARFEFSDDWDGKMTRDIAKQLDFSDTHSIASGDCRSIDSGRCNAENDCFNNGYGSCFRKDMVWGRSNTDTDYAPAQRTNSKGCECLKGECQVRPDVDRDTLDKARILGLPQSTRKKSPYVDLFKVWNDGKAYVEGLVNDREGGCFALGSGTQCYLRLKVGKANTKVFLVYNEFNGNVTKDYVSSDPQHTKSILYGDAVQAFGAYVQDTIYAEGSADYFIKFADEETPQAVKERLLK